MQKLKNLKRSLRNAYKAQFINNHPLLSSSAQMGNLQLLLLPGQGRMDFPSVCLAEFAEGGERAIVESP